MSLITKPKFEYYLLIFTVVDILFAPYVFFIATTYSQFLVFIWFIIKDKRYFHKKELLFYYSIMFFVGISVFISLFTIPQKYLDLYVFDNFKRGLSFLMGISYYFFFYYIFKTTHFEIKKWIFAFLGYIVLWGVLYYLNMSLFLSLKRFFNPFDAFTNVFTSNLDYFNRFNFIWTDPNNVGYAIVSVCAFLVANRQTNTLSLVIVLISLLFVVLLTMSGGSVLTTLLIIPLSLLIRIKNNFQITRIIFLSFALIVSFILIINFSNQILSSEIGELAITRLEDKKDTEEPRLRIWQKILEEKNILTYILAGEGSNLFINNKPYAPHSGHLALIFGYGVFTYIMYMYLFFRKSKNQSINDLIYIAPFLICFTLNVGIGELKFAALMYMLIAFSRIKCDRQVFLNRYRITSQQV